MTNWSRYLSPSQREQLITALQRLESGVDSETTNKWAIVDTDPTGLNNFSVLTELEWLNPTNAIIRANVDGTSGNWKLTYDSQQTANIAFNATGNAVRLALEALSNIAPGDVVVTGGPGNSGGQDPYIIEFGGELAGIDIVLTASDTLSGGNSEVIITTITTGGS